MLGDFHESTANLLALRSFNSLVNMESKKLLTIAQTAELLNCSTGFVRKRIALTESHQDGGWPKSTYVNLQPKGAKSLFRINKDALEEYLKGQEEQATVVCPMK